MSQNVPEYFLNNTLSPTLNSGSTNTPFLVINLPPIANTIPMLGMSLFRACSGIMIRPTFSGSSIVSTKTLPDVALKRILTFFASSPGKMLKLAAWGRGRRIDLSYWWLSNWWQSPSNLTDQDCVQLQPGLLDLEIYWWRRKHRRD